MTAWLLIKQGGVALIPLGFCSLLVVTVILERIWAFSRVGSMPKELFLRVENLLAACDWQEAIRLLDDSRSPFARIAKASLMRRKADAQEITDILTLACDAEIAHATRPLPVLGTVGNIAPFIGLFGTVLGIMRAFQDVAHMGAGNSAVVSQGIAEALIATAVGLSIGICAVVANNWCTAWVENYRLQLERFSTEWSYQMKDLRQLPSQTATSEEVAA